MMEYITLGADITFLGSDSAIQPGDARMSRMKIQYSKINAVRKVLLDYYELPICRRLVQWEESDLSLFICDTHYDGQVELLCLTDDELTERLVDDIYGMVCDAWADDRRRLDPKEELDLIMTTGSEVYHVGCKDHKHHKVDGYHIFLVHR